MDAKTVLGVRIQKALKRNLTVLAKADCRTISNFVEILLNEALQARLARQSQTEKVA